MSDEPFARPLPPSSLARGYRVDDQGRRIDNEAEQAAKRRRLTKAVLAAVGIKPETKEQS